MLIVVLPLTFSWLNRILLLALLFQNTTQLPLLPVPQTAGLQPAPPYTHENGGEKLPAPLPRYATTHTAVNSPSIVLS